MMGMGNISAVECETITGAYQHVSLLSLASREGFEPIVNCPDVSSAKYKKTINK